MRLADQTETIPLRYLKFANLILFLLILISSCKKDEKPEIKPDPEIIYPNYSQLKTGNYWIYQVYEIDTAGNERATKSFDSMYVEKDTMINNKTYAKLLAVGDYAYTPVSFLRDSLHYIVDEKGRIRFSSEDFSNVIDVLYATAGISDTICRIEVKMQDKDKIFTVPAGNFKTSTAKSTYYFYPRWQMYGSQRNTYNRYTEKIGLISEGFIFGIANPNYYERRLVRYKLN